MSWKKSINERRAQQIAEAISTPGGRFVLYASMWFPMEIPRIGETKLEWAKRKAQQLSDEYEALQKRESSEPNEE